MNESAWRVVSGPDGKTRFEEQAIPFSPVEGIAPLGVFYAASLGSSAAALVRFEVGFESGFHNTDAETWMFVMRGQMNLEVSDGVSRLLGPGDVVFFSDSTGEGHSSHVVGDVPVLVATAGFAG